MKKSLCLLIKNENKYLKEWIQWHLNQGFNHFYIYNTGTEDPSIIVNEFDKNSFTIINWHNSYVFNMQIEAYTHCLQIGKKDDWIAFFDIDEFIYLPNNNYLDNINSNIDLIFIKQKLFNANGQLYYKDQLVQQRFSQECKNVENFKDYKSIVRPNKIKNMGPHEPLFFNGEKLYDSNCFYNHYYTKSLEEWEEKISRGSCDPRCKKKYSSFFLYNPDLLNYKQSNEIIQSYLY